MIFTLSWHKVMVKKKKTFAFKFLAWIKKKVVFGFVLLQNCRALLFWEFPTDFQDRKIKERESEERVYWNSAKRFIENARKGGTVLKEVHETPDGIKITLVTEKRLEVVFKLLIRSTLIGRRYILCNKYCTAIKFSINRLDWIESK